MKEVLQLYHMASPIMFNRKFYSVFLTVDVCVHFFHFVHKSIPYRVCEWDMCSDKNYSGDMYIIPNTNSNPSTLALL